MQSEEGQIDSLLLNLSILIIQEDLFKYIIDNSITDIVICGLHYGKCITTTATILLDANPTTKDKSLGRNLFTQKEICVCFGLMMKSVCTIEFINKWIWT